MLSNERKKVALIVGDGVPGCFLISTFFSLSFVAVAKLAVVIPEQIPLDRVHFLQPPKSGPNKARRRRSGSLQLEEDVAQLLIRLPVRAGLHPTSDLYLMLHHDDRFLAPGFSVEEIDESQRIHRHRAVDQLCFYTGHVLNRSHDSFASLSTCGGLVVIYINLLSLGCVCVCVGGENR